VTGYPIRISGKVWEDISTYIEADDTPFDVDEWTRHEVGRGYQVRAVLSEDQLGELVWLMRSRVSYLHPSDKNDTDRQIIKTIRRLVDEHPDLWANGRDWGPWLEADGSERWGWGVPA
jgi:hypothetical protein